jgi:hypothetical protein
MPKPDALLLLCGLACAPALAGCSSTRSAPSAIGVPTRIRVVSYTSQQAFELVNETHTDRVALYSQTRATAATKVQTDEVVDEILEHFAALGFYERARPGLAPAQGTGGLVRALEIDTPGNPMHLAIGQGSSAEDQDVFRRCFASFLQVYNETYQLQSVGQHPGWSPSSGDAGPRPPQP